MGDKNDEKMAGLSWSLFLMLAVVAISAVPLGATPQLAPPSDGPPSTPSPTTAPSTLHLKGRFVGSVSVDHQTVVFCINADSSRWFYATNPWAALFAAAHAGTELDLTVEAVSTDTLDTGELFTAYGLTHASLNGFESREWHDNMIKTLGYERASKLLNALADSFEVDAKDPRGLPTCNRFRKK
jgi:hypothetical protein